MKCMYYESVIIDSKKEERDPSPLNANADRGIPKCGSSGNKILPYLFL